MPKLEVTPANGKKVAIVGSGAAGLAAALVLAQMGYEVDILDRQAKPGGAVRYIPAHRMDPGVLDTDIAWLLEHPRVHLHASRAVDDPGALLAQGYAAVLLAGGPARAHHAWASRARSWPCRASPTSPIRARSRRRAGRVVVVGGGAIACDCATTALARGATGVEMITLEQWSELPLTPKERRELLEHPVNLVGRTRVMAVLASGGRVSGVRSSAWPSPRARSSTRRR